MALVSMTGFARAEGRDASYAWTWEAKSVNGRTLDTRCRLPAGYDRLEMPARRLVEAHLRRGSVSLTLSIASQADAAQYRINRALLASVLELRSELKDVVADAPPTLEGLMAIRGMVEPVDGDVGEAEIAGRDRSMLATLEEAVVALGRERTREGARLADAVGELLVEIGDRLAAARSSAAAQPEAIAARLRSLIDALVETAGRIPEDRLAQEAALAVGRADVREELDRIAAHLEAARALAAGDQPAGRRLDFLCQELNREANTLCAKAADLDLHAIGLALKALIEQLREQVQNVE